MDYSIEITHTGDTSFSAHVKTSEKIKEEADKLSLNMLKKEKKLPGFRKGKVPEHVLKSKFKEDFESESLYKAIDMTIADVEKEAERKIFRITNIENTERNEKYIGFDIQCETYPYVTLNKLKEITVKEHIPKIEESEIQKQLEEVQQYSAEYEDKGEEPAVIGDRVTIDYELFQNGIPSDPVSDSKFILGDHSMDKEIEEEMIKAQPQKGKEIKISTDVSQRRGDEMLDKLAEYDSIRVDLVVQVKSVEKVILPPIDDELAKRNDPEKTPDLESLRNQIQVGLERQFRGENLDLEIGAAIEKLEGAASFYISDTYIDERINSMLKNEADTSSLTEEQKQSLRDYLTAYEKRSLVMEELYKEISKSKPDENFNEEFKKYLLDQFGEKQSSQLFALYQMAAAGQKLDEYTENMVNNAHAMFQNERIFNYFMDNGQVKKGKKMSLEKILALKKEAKPETPEKK